MAGDKGKTNGDEGPAKGWDLWKLKWIAEPPETLAAAVEVLVGIIFLVMLASGVVALFELLAPIWGLGVHDNHAPAPGVDPGAELRGRLLIIGALLTTPFLIWRLVVSHWAARAAQKQAHVAQETARNALYTKAVEQLGAMREVTETISTRAQFGMTAETRERTVVRPNTEVRLGAIYALEKLARDDVAMHWPIMETLCAYIRENAGRSRPPTDEIVAIFRKPFRERDVDEDKSIAEYGETLVAPSADVQAAISVLGRRTKAQREYERTRREGASTRARVSWRLDLTGCHLALANFDGLDFADARFDRSTLQYTRFKGTCLEAVSFSESHLQAAELDEAQLAGASFFETHLESSSLDKASLTYAWLFSAHCECASFNDADLRGAMLHGVKFAQATLSGAMLEDALEEDADFRNAKGLTQVQLDSIWGNEATQIPLSLALPVNERWLTLGASKGARAHWRRNSLAAFRSRRTEGAKQRTANN